MMNTTKKLIMTLLLALLLPVFAMAEDVYDFEVDGIYYKIVEEEACVTYKSYRNISHTEYFESDYTGDVVIPSSVTYDGKTYPVTQIGDHAFYRNPSVTGITIPSSVTYISWNAFYECTGLNRVTISDLAAWCNMDIRSNPIYYAHHLYLNDTEVTDLTIPDGITAIKGFTFAGCAGLTSVTISNSVTSIGENAFDVCTGLTSVFIGNSVTEIGGVAFEGCTALTSVTLGNSVTVINISAFAGCTALKEIKIPNSVTEIGVNAFNGCTALASATLGNAVKTIGGSAFRNCTSLTSIKIPDQVTDIGVNAFYGCTGLTNVTIGKSVTSIGKDAFQNDPAIESITCRATAPPSWSDMSMFTTNVYNHTPLHVPTGTEGAYKYNQCWGQFLTIIGSDDEPGDGYEYVPFVREGVKWTYSIQDYRYEKDYGTNPARGDNKVYRTLELRGDTVINGKTYKAMHKCTDDVYSEPSDVIIVYLREEDKKVYGIVPNGVFYDDARICNTPLAIEDNAILSGEEFLLYDFQDPVTYWNNLIYRVGFELQLDTIEVGGHYAKRIFYGGQEEVYFQVIEGIGAMGMNSYPLAFLTPIGTGIHDTEYYNLEKVVENGEVIYPKNYVEDRYLPVIREGMKWVNKYVEINNDGDTTYHYYTYEFKDNYPERDSYNRVFKAVYTKNYDANGVAYGDERLVAGLREDEACILSFRNEPLSWMNDLINFYTYQGNEDVRLLHENLEGMWDIDYYINNQSYPHMNLLDAENFVKAEPIVIDGTLCSRIAYIGEQGDTLAYLVEGIGFDSRDLGDLLTPFTRYPDADCGECYQEYCGLSHVVKDGKIIYKGLLYQDGVTVGIDDIDCDVNGDGSVNITDVDNVVVIIINGGNGHDRINEHGQIIGDVNHDGVVNISDLNLIINTIINH